MKIEYGKFSDPQTIYQYNFPESDIVFFSKPLYGTGWLFLVCIWKIKLKTGH